MLSNLNIRNLTDIELKNKVQHLLTIKTETQTATH